MEPALSVVIAGSRVAGLHSDLEHALGRDLCTGRVELLVSTARNGGAVPDGATVLAHPHSTSLPQLRLTGVRAARAPLVAVTEDFCLPTQGWASELIAHHERTQAAAVGGPVSRRVGSRADWALTLIEYGRFFRATPEGWVSDLPPINVAYDADFLRASLADDVEGLFEGELHHSLRERGGRFWRAPKAIIFDESAATLAGAAEAQFHHGRLFGGRRVQDQGTAARLLRSLLAPAVPAILLSRIVREVRAAGHGRECGRAMPFLGVLLCAWASGEAVGSLFGVGDSESRWA